MAAFTSVMLGVGAAASLGGAAIQAGAAGSAAEEQAAAAERSRQLQETMYGQQREDLSAYRQAGTTALSQLADPSLTRQFTQADFQADPGYEFRMAEGQKAIERSASARGGIAGGRTMKELSRFGQGLASQEYGAAYGRFTGGQERRMRQLSGIAGLGQASAAQTAAQAGQFGRSAGAAMQDIGTAQAAGTIGAGQAYAGGLSNIGQMGMGAALYSDQKSWMDKWRGQQSAQNYWG